MEKYETLDEIIEKYRQECARSNNTSADNSAAEQFTEFVEKYERKSKDDGNRWAPPCLQGIGA